MELIKFHSVIIAAVIFIFCCDIICQCQRSDKVKMQNHFMLIKLISFIKYSSVNMIQIQCTVKCIKMAYSLWTERQFRRKIVKWTQLILFLYIWTTTTGWRDWRGSSSGLGSRSFICIQLVQSSEEEDVWNEEHASRRKYRSYRKPTCSN